MKEKEDLLSDLAKRLEVLNSLRGSNVPIQGPLKAKADKIIEEDERIEEKNNSIEKESELNDSGELNKLSGLNEFGDENEVESILNGSVSAYSEANTYEQNKGTQPKTQINKTQINNSEEFIINSFDDTFKEGFENGVENNYEKQSLQDLLKEYDALDKKYNVRRERTRYDRLPTKVPRYFSFQKNLSLIQEGLVEATAVQKELNKKYRAESSFLGRIWHVLKASGYKMVGKELSSYTNQELIKKEMRSLQKILNGIEGIYNQSNLIIDKTRTTIMDQLEEKNKVDAALVKYREERVERQRLGKEMYNLLKAHSNLEVDKVSQLKKSLMACEHRIKDLDSLIFQSYTKSQHLGAMINDLNKSTNLMIQYRDFLDETYLSAKNAYERCKLIQPLFDNIDNGAKAASMIHGEVKRLSDTITLLWSKTFGNLKILAKIADSSGPQTMYNKELARALEDIKQSFNDQKYAVFEEIEEMLSSEIDDIEYDVFDKEFGYTSS